MFFKSPAAVLRKSTANAAKRVDRSALPRPHTTSGLPMHLSSYVSFCAYSSQWDPSIYGAGNPCPPPPRGTLNDSKLAFLDWQMALIKFERERDAANNENRIRAEHSTLQTVESVDVDTFEVLAGNGEAVEHLVQETALRAGVNQLEVPEESLVRTRKPVQRLSGFAPRPHTTDGSITTAYVPKIPGRFYAVAQPRDEEPEFQPTAMASVAPAPSAQDIEASTRMMMNAVLVPVHSNDTEESSGASTPSTSTSPSVIGSSSGSEWAAASGRATGSRHRATSSVATSAFEAHERRNGFGSKGPVSSHNFNTRDAAYELSDPEATKYNQNKPLPPLGVGPNMFFSPPPFAPNHYNDLAPVRESSHATPQPVVGAREPQQTKSSRSPDRASRQADAVNADTQDRPLSSASVLASGRSRSVLSRAVNRFRPTTPSASTERDSEVSTSATNSAVKTTSSRLSFFNSGREVSRKRSRSTGATSFLDSSEDSAQRRQDAIEAAQGQRQRAKSALPPRPNSRMTSVLSLRPTFRRAASAAVQPSKAPARLHHQEPQQDTAAAEESSVFEEVQDELAESEDRRALTSMSTRQRSGNLFKAANNWLRSRSRADEVGSSPRTSVRSPAHPRVDAAMFSPSSALISAA
ncbi:unnamed protein product [Tilletia caries]|nr:hypothetical protein CF336_g3766 [Tilletia laevis]CAD6908471.1 unnamed protein product [Tilletia caries]